MIPVTVYVPRHRSAAPPTAEQVRDEAHFVSRWDAGRTSLPAEGRHAAYRRWPLTDPDDRFEVDEGVA